MNHAGYRKINIIFVMHKLSVYKAECPSNQGTHNWNEKAYGLESLLSAVLFFWGKGFLLKFKENHY